MLKTSTSDLRRVVLGGCAASLTAWVAVMTVFMLRTPAGDYAVYRSLSPAVLDGRSLYDLRLGGLAFTYPAFAALPLSLLSKVGFGAGLFLLTAASFAALARTVVVLARAVVRERPGAGGNRLLASPELLALAFLAVAVWFAPVTKTLLNGQLNLLLLWLVVEDVLGDVPPRWRGVLTGIATGIKLTPGLFIVTMLLTGRRAWAGRASATFAVTAAIGFVVEPAGSLHYWQHLGGSTGFGNPFGFGNQSIMYALVRMAGDLQLAPLDYRVFLPVAIALVAAALLVARRLHVGGHELATWGITAVAMLAVAPVSWSHHWVWMLLPLAAVVAMVPATVGGRAMLVFTVVVLCSSIVSLMPRLDFTGWPWRVATETVLGNAYLIAGLALLLWFAAFAFGRRRRPRHIDLTSGDRVDV